MFKYAEIGSRMRYFGENKFSTMADFARALAIEPVNLTPYLNGRTRPGNKLQNKLRDLGCDIEWLMTGKTQEHKICTKSEQEILSFLQSIGVDSVDKIKTILSPENTIKDISYALYERLQKYAVKKRKDRL